MKISSCWEGLDFELIEPFRGFPWVLEARLPWKHQIDGKDKDGVGNYQGFKTKPSKREIKRAREAAVFQIRNFFKVTSVKGTESLPKWVFL